MAVVPICYKVPYKGNAQLNHYAMRQSDMSSNMCRNWHISSFLSTDVLTQKKTREASASKELESHPSFILANNERRQNIGMVLYASDSGTNEKQLRSLDSYLGKLQNGTNLPADKSNRTGEPLTRNGQLRLKKGLESLDDYFGKLNKDGASENYTSSSVDLATENNPTEKLSSINQDSEKSDEREEQKSYRNPVSTRDDHGPQSSQDSQQYNEISDLYLISILGSINVAVFLFEIASPVRSSDLGLFSLPLLYGAKINDLILVGEWWRLVTPMFLHSGLFHIVVGCWGLVTFGPKVCRGYGSFTFFLIYILGGISGNLISFLHTPEPTVGGTGPIFAMMGAWLTYQVQNKDIISKEVSESMFRKAVITTLLSFTLSSFGPIDDWSHFGAAFTGVAYGFLTCPTLQLDDASSSTSGQEEGITLVRRYADPCKSLFFFTLFALVLTCLLFFVEPPLNVIASDTSL
ncbi:hypothetical protein ACE6H2_011968 [Prunus campanulata]